MSEQATEGVDVSQTPSKRDILERAWSKYWYFAQEAVPGRVEELQRLLPAARTYGITAPLENFLKRHTGEVISIKIELPVGSPEQRHGAHDDEVGSIFGPWEHQVAGIRHPAWVTRDGGKWRAMLKRLEVNVALDDALFARP